MDLNLIAQIIAAGALSISMLGAILAKDLLRAAIFLAVGSVLLGIIFFIYKAPFTGAVEISVGAGLITALLVTAISLTEEM
jgi:energy-converting hydrogenase B subunit D